MDLALLRTSIIYKLAAFFGAISLLLISVSNVFAQEDEDLEDLGDVDLGAKGATGDSLPDAGTVEITYAIFVGGVVLFVFGMLKLALSWRKS